jgi:hypothetical protein
MILGLISQYELVYTAMITKLLYILLVNRIAKIDRIYYLTKKSKY